MSALSEEADIWEVGISVFVLQRRVVVLAKFQSLPASLTALCPPLPPPIYPDNSTDSVPDGYRMAQNNSICSCFSCYLRKILQKLQPIARIIACFFIPLALNCLQLRNLNEWRQRMFLSSLKRSQFHQVRGMRHLKPCIIWTHSRKGHKSNRCVPN